MTTYDLKLKNIFCHFIKTVIPIYSTKLIPNVNIFFPINSKIYPVKFPWWMPLWFGHCWCFLWNQHLLVSNLDQSLRKFHIKKHQHKKDCKIQTFILSSKYANESVQHLFHKRSIQLKSSSKMYSKLTLFDPGPTCISAAVPRFSLQFQLIY